MAAKFVVEGKLLGQKKPLFTDWHVDLPPIWQCGGDRIRLRDLITQVVIEEVDGFNKRQAESRFARILSRSEIERGVRIGKVNSGEMDLQQPVNFDEAVGIALQAFEDGLYYVFVDGIQQNSLESEVYLSANSSVTFVRLVALAGG